MNKNVKTGIAVAAALAVIALFFVFSNPSLTSAIPASTASTGASQILSQDETQGSGQGASLGDTLTVNYTGKLQDGTVFDTSVGKRPIQFVLGAGQVIPGWDQGLMGMKAGGKRLLVIPPDLAYGTDGYGSVPPNATLIFEVDLLAITPGSPVQQ